MQDLDEKQKINSLAGNLDKLSNALTLSPYDAEGNYKGKWLSVSGVKIEPTYTICPTSFMWNSRLPRMVFGQFSRSKDTPSIKRCQFLLDNAQDAKHCV